MYTDPEHLQITDPGHVEGNVVFAYLDAFCEPEHFSKFLPEYENLDAMKDHYRRGGLGDGTCKKFLFNIMEDFLQPMRERRAQYEQNIPLVYEILRKGSEAARAEAAKTLADVRKAMKIDYFDDADLIAEHTKKYQK
jgi:tryptophanyl-tRNA synthetase